MYMPSKEIQLIVDDELVWIFHYLEPLEAERLEDYVVLLAIRLH